MASLEENGETIALRQHGPFVVAAETTRMPMIFIDAAGTGNPIVFANDAFLKLTGYSHQEVIGQQLDFLLIDSGDCRLVIATADSDEDRDVCCRRRNGTTFWATVLISTIIDNAGATTHFFASFSDQTRHIAERDKILALSADVAAKAAEIRALQISMIRTARLSAIGMVGATMAHELNQPLTAITSYLRGARLRINVGKVPLPDGVLDALTLADESAMRASHIIRKVRDVVKRRPDDERQEHLRLLIEEACDLARAGAPEREIEILFSFSDTDDVVLADRVGIQQVIINLIQNAIDAASSDRARHKIFVSTSLQADSMYQVSVRDTGPGISAEAIAHLFEPFNSTKPDGVGIGLSISRTIVEAHGGQMWLDSSTSDGADFRFSIPHAPRTTADAATAP